MSPRSNSWSKDTNDGYVHADGTASARETNTGWFHRERRRRHWMNHEVNCQRFHLGHGRSLSKGAQRESGRVGNVDNVNYMDVIVEHKI